MEFNGSEVTEMRKLPRLVAETKVNSKSDVIIWRNEKRKKINVLIAEMKEDKKIVQKTNKNSNENLLKTEYIKKLGLTLSTITNEIRMNQNIPMEVSGLLVTNVDQNTDAEMKGIRPGDIIQEVNQNSIADIDTLKKIITSLNNNRGILLLINRQGNINFVALKLN